MYKFGKKSLESLSTVDWKLEALCNLVIQKVDFSVIEGHRSVLHQKELYDQGYSQIDGVTKKGKHNQFPSQAIDVLPYKKGVNPFDGTDASELMFWRLLWEFKRASKELGVPITLGAFWSFKDFSHIELAEA
jgi:peptidoglycan LD-endopeptidase CwlK